MQAVKDLGAKLEKIRAIVEAEARGEDIADESAYSPADSETSVDGADDGEELSDATGPKTGKVAMALRVRMPSTWVTASITLTNCHAAKTHSKPFQI